MMERRFDMTDFEQSLRDHADQFIMVPSKRVWNGIYNNLHPGSRWPSITVALVFLFTLITIGYLNNTPKQFIKTSAFQENQKKANPENLKANLNSTADVNSYSGINSTSIKKQSAINSTKPVEKKDISNFVEKDFTSINKEAGEYNPIQQIGTASTRQYSKTIGGNKVEKEKRTMSVASANNKAYTNTQSTVIANSIENTFIVKDLFPQRLNAISDRDESKDYIKKSEFILNESSGFIKNNELGVTINGIQPNYLSEKFSSDPVQPTVIHLEEKTQEGMKNNNNTVLYKETKTGKNKPARIHKKRNPKVNWVYFVTPTVSSVFFRGEAIPPNVSQNFSPIIVQQNQNMRNRLYNARLGYEAGTQMTYAFSKRWQFITGINFSNSGYNIISNQVHPTFAYLMLKEEHTGIPYAKSYITHYGNGQGQNQISLSNRSLQASVPVGLQYVLWGNKNVQVTMASSIEPSIVVKSNAYIISSDGRNYVNDPSLLRKLNIGGNFGSYVTFSSKKMKWQVGPNVRYQILSTYQKYYPVKEHLIDYGIRIGISK